MILALSACGGAGASSSSSSNQTTSVKLMVGGLNKQIYLPNMLTQQLAYFKEQNLNVTFIDEGSGQGSEQEVVAGNVDAGSGSYNHTIELQAAGKNIQSVCQFGIAPGEAEVVDTEKASSITGVSDLKGKNLGVTDLGSGTQTVTSALLGQKGVSADQVNWVAVGAGNTFIAAINQQRIDAGMTTEPTISRLVQSGQGKVLVDLRTPASTRAALGGDYPFIGIFMRTDYLNSHQDVTQRLVNAYTKTLKWMHGHTAVVLSPGPLDFLPLFLFGLDRRLVGEVVGVGLVHVGRLALEAGDEVLLDLQHVLWATSRHLAVRAEDLQLVLQRLNIERLVARVVLGRHLVSDLRDSPPPTRRTTRHRRFDCIRRSARSHVPRRLRR